MIHELHCNYSYHINANHSLDFSCNDAYMETLEQRIKRLREGNKLSQQQVADRVGVSRVAVTKWESGQTANLKLSNLISLCELFNISVEELIKGISGAANGTRTVSPAATTQNKLRIFESFTVEDYLSLSKEQRELVEKVALSQMPIKSRTNQKATS